MSAYILLMALFVMSPLVFAKAKSDSSATVARTSAISGFTSFSRLGNKKKISQR